MTASTRSAVGIPRDKSEVSIEFLYVLNSDFLKAHEHKSRFFLKQPSVRGQE